MKHSNTFERELWRELYARYIIEEQPIEEIAEALGYAQVQSIYKVLDQYGIPKQRRNKHLYNPLYVRPFTERQEQIILGSLLGDGGIMDRSSKNPIFREMHSVKQLEYIDWKARELYPFVKGVKIGHKGEDAYFKSAALPQLHFYRNVFYGDKGKHIPIEILDWLDDLAVAVWYMDDGSYTQTNHVIRIASHSFSAVDNARLQGWMLGKYGIRMGLMFEREYSYLQVRRQSNQKFLDLVEPHIVPSMRYKLGQ